MTEPVERTIWSGIEEGKVDAKRIFRLWACGDSHVTTDIMYGYESLKQAIVQSEFGDPKRGGPPFPWDIAVHVGDLAGGQLPPTDEDGEEVVRQFKALQKHRREDIYDLAGNHDASGPDEPTQWWFRKWVDPTGENTEFSGIDRRRRPYPVEGTWERYHFEVGNMLFLVMGDRNDGGPPRGRGERGGYPAGAVTEETFAWWKSMVESHPDHIIMTFHHHMLRETTVGSGPWEGFKKNEHGKWKAHYHGYFEDGAPEGASYLYWVGDRRDAGAFENYLEAHPGAIDFWIGGHTHTHPDDILSGRSHLEKKWGVQFLNCSALTRHHAGSIPMSRVLTFVEGHPEVRVQCYLHTDDHAPRGWYPNVEKIVPLSRPFMPPTKGRSRADGP